MSARMVCAPPDPESLTMDPVGEARGIYSKGSVTRTTATGSHEVVMAAERFDMACAGARHASKGCRTWDAHQALMASHVVARPPCFLGKEDALMYPTSTFEALMRMDQKTCGEDQQSTDADDGEVH